jgi:hypothetical protein
MAIINPTLTTIACTFIYGKISFYLAVREIHVADVRGHWWALVNTVTNLQVPQKAKYS